MRILLYVKNTLWQANEIVPEKENVLKDVAGNNGEWGGGGRGGDGQRRKQNLSKQFPVRGLLLSVTC